MKIRTGTGLDVHRFETGRHFYLGGILIPYHSGLVGHSDADALIHAIMDALLGAAGLNDIGYYFPDSDPQYKNIRSTVLLEKVNLLILQNNFTIGNIDTIVCLQEPKISPYIADMKKVISGILQIQIDDISIKATTFEHMGFVGEKEGILCVANVLVVKQDRKND
jgi:2-C-methyl-D-erythritol 2,4-cyclodiphosphate synthase